MLRRAGTWLGLLLVTLFAVGVMFAVSADWFSDPPVAKKVTKTLKLTTTPVAVLQVEEESVKIVEKFSGRLEPFESYTFAFDMSGRLTEFGKSDDGLPLDEGMTVRKGQLLAKLDDRLLRAKLLSARAQLDEAKARLEKSDSDYRRAKDLQARGSGLITAEEFGDRSTRWKEATARLAMADAMLQQADRNLEDTRIASPIDGVISKRHVQAGESIRQHDPVFEVVQIDRVLLVVGVPESKIRKIHPGQRVNLDFIGRGTFGHRWASRTGRVHQVAETENEVSKLFDVEILVNNSTGELKPGLIALASIEIQEVHGFQIPVSSVLFRIQRDPKTGARRETGFIFSVSEQTAPSATGTAVAADDKGKPSHVAHRFQLGDWVEQDMNLVLLDLPPEHHTIVVRGQHRLVDGRPVQIVTMDKPASSANDRYDPIYGPDAEQYDQRRGLPDTGPRAAERRTQDR